MLRFSNTLDNFDTSRIIKYRAMWRERERERNCYNPILGWGKSARLSNILYLVLFHNHREIIAVRAVLKSYLYVLDTYMKKIIMKS